MAKTRATRTSAATATAVATKSATKPGAAALKRRPFTFPKSVTGAIDASRAKKATDIVVLDLRKAGGFTDYFVICTGTNPRQIHAIAEAVEATLRKEFGERPALAEGLKDSEWILLDYFNFVVHVFSRECRTFYSLERLWGSAERHEFPDEP